MKISNRLKNRNSTRHHGGALIEFLLTFPIFLGLVFMMIDLMMYCYALVSAKYVVSHVAREAAVGHYSAENIYDANTNVVTPGIIDKIKEEVTTLGLIPYFEETISVGDNQSQRRGCSTDTPFRNHVQICRVGFGTCEWAEEGDFGPSKFGCNGSDGDGLITDTQSVEEVYPMSIIFRFGYPMTSWFMFMGEHIQQPTKSFVPIQAEEIVRIEPQG